MGVSVAIGVGIGAVVGGGAAAIQSGGDFNAIWKGALVGAVGGAVGGWAAPALVGTLGTVGAGMAAGGLGGITSGVLGTALSGGNSSDYLKNGLFGGLTGAAMGGITSGLSGGGEGVNPVTGEPVPTGSPTITADPYAASPGTLPTDSAAATLTSDVPVQGLGNSGAPTVDAVQNSITGAPAQGNAPAPFDQYAAAPTTTMTDASGSSPIPQQLPGGVPLDATASTAADTYAPFGGDITPTASTTDFSNWAQSGQQNTNNAMKAFNLDQGSSGMGEGMSMPGQQTASAIPGGQNVDYAGGSVLDGNGWSLKNILGQGKDKLGNAMMGQMMGNALKGAGSIAGMNEAKQNRNQLMDLYNQQNAQYQTQNAAANQYQNQLQQTYSDPNAYLNSPEAQSTRQLAMQKLLAQNAMAGRRTAGLPMQQQLMNNQLANLNAYRQTLGNNARGAYASPTGLQQTLSASQAQSPTGNLFAGLGSMFAPAATYYLMQG